MARQPQRQPALSVAHILRYRRMCDFTNGPSPQMRMAVAREARGYMGRVIAEIQQGKSLKTALANVNQVLHGD